MNLLSMCFDTMQNALFLDLALWLIQLQSKIMHSKMLSYVAQE